MDLAQVMPLSLEGYCWLRPQCPQNVHLLFNLGAARLKISIHCFKLCLVPTNSQAQSQTPTTENIKGCGLFRQQQRLPTGSNYDPCRQFKSLCPACQESIEHQRLMPGIIRTKAIESDQILIAQIFHCLGKGA